MARVEKTEAVLEPSKSNKSLAAIVVLAVLLCVSIGIGGYFFYQYKHVGAASGEIDEVASLTKTLGAMMMLPEGEAPTLATVTDKEKLSGQSFFQGAENGDKVLIYTHTGRAILYRPSMEKIIDVTTVNVSEKNDQKINEPAESAVETEATVKEVESEALIVLANGTEKKGITQKFEDEISAEYPGVTVTDKVAAQRKDYEKTLVVDVSGKQRLLAKKLSLRYEAEIAALPEGEPRPEADILVIFGKDRW